MKKLLSIIFALTLITGFTSCLKDRAEIGDKPQNIIEFYTTDDYVSSVRSLYPVYGTQYLAGGTGSFDVTVSYSGTDTAPQDITVVVAVDQDALDRYNTKATATGDGTYIALPSTYYTVPTTTVVIKKGQRRVTFPVNISITSSFDFSKSYALPLTIKSATMGTISGNYGSVLYQIGAKNVYDGTYSDNGFMLRIPDDEGLGGNFKNISVPLKTKSVNSLAFVPTFNSGATVGGIANTVITVDPATNKVTMSSDNAALQNTPGYDNRYDPATKTFYLSFFWSATRGHTDTLVYKGPR